MRALLLSVLFVFSIHQTLDATLIVPADFREIVSGSDLIVHGRVIDVRAEWVDGRSRLESVVTIQTATIHRGTAGSTVTFRTPGGEVGRYRSVTVGAPQFRVGDEAVLFLKTDGPAGPRIFGLNQGLFRVQVDPRTGRRQVKRHVLAARGSGAERVKRGEPRRQLLTLDAFNAMVRSALTREGVR